MVKITDYIEQIDMFLNAKKNCILTIDLDTYEEGDSLVIDEVTGIIWVKSLLTHIKFEDNFEFDLVLDYAVDIKIQKMQRINKEYILLKYNADDTIAELSTETQDIGKQINYMERLLGGREIFKDVNHLLLKLKDVYAQHSDMDLVHMEVLISNILRDKTDPSKPARLGKIWNPKLINIKEIVFKSGFLQSLNFENISKSLMYGLIQEKPTEQSILEKILLGEIIKVKGK